jgi:hypothetical protein
MDLVAELLDHGGFLPVLAELDQKKRFFSRKNGIVFSIFWMILLMMLIPAIIGIVNGLSEAQAISAVIGLFGGLMIMIGSLTLLPSSAPQPVLNAQRTRALPATTGSLPASHKQALPLQQSIPVSVHLPPQAGMWRDTNDLESSRFTESTTRPLEKDEHH